MSALIYYVEQLLPIKTIEWAEEDCDTLAWTRVPNMEFSSIGSASQFVQDTFDKRLSYRVTDGGRYWSI